MSKKEEPKREIVKREIEKARKEGIPMFVDYLITEKEEPKRKNCLDETLELRAFGDKECCSCPSFEKCKIDADKILKELYD